MRFAGFSSFSKEGARGSMASRLKSVFSSDILTASCANRFANVPQETSNYAEKSFLRKLGWTGRPLSAGTALARTIREQIDPIVSANRQGHWEDRPDEEGRLNATLYTRLKLCRKAAITRGRHLTKTRVCAYCSTASASASARVRRWTLPTPLAVSERQRLPFLGDPNGSYRRPCRLSNVGGRPRKS
jgi:hypothetical protein